MYMCMHSFSVSLFFSQSSSVFKDQGVNVGLWKMISSFVLQCISSWTLWGDLRSLFFFMSPSLQTAFDSKMLFSGCEVSNGLICYPDLPNTFRFSNWYNGHAWWSRVEPHQGKSRDHGRWVPCHKNIFLSFGLMMHLLYLPPTSASVFFLPRSCEICMFRLTAYWCRFNFTWFSE